MRIINIIIVYALLLVAHIIHVQHTINILCSVD
jgi:hypothetical protein